MNSGLKIQIQEEKEKMQFVIIEFAVYFLKINNGYIKLFRII